VISLVQILSCSRTFFLYDLAFSLALFEVNQREFEWLGDSFFIGITEVFDGLLWGFELLRDLHLQLISGSFPVSARKEHILVVNWLAFACFLLGALGLSV
jgi:hypothetical protein